MFSFVMVWSEDLLLTRIQPTQGLIYNILPDPNQVTFDQSTDNYARFRRVGQERKKGKKKNLVEKIRVGLSGICKSLLFTCPFCSTSVTCHVLPLLGIFLFCFYSKDSLLVFLSIQPVRTNSQIMKIHQFQCQLLYQQILLGVFIEACHANSCRV